MIAVNILLSNDIIKSYRYEKSTYQTIEEIFISRDIADEITKDIDVSDKYYIRSTTVYPDGKIFSSNARDCYVNTYVDGIERTLDLLLSRIESFLTECVDISINKNNIIVLNENTIFKKIDIIRLKKLITRYRSLKTTDKDNTIIFTIQKLY